MPHWPTDRWRRQRNNAAAHSPPLALIQRTSGGIRLIAVDALAAANGLTPGMRLADARALVPDLINGDADPAGDQEALAQLCDWCSRFSPWASVDGSDGLILDASGVPHLFGGETAMLQMMQQAFAQLGCDARLAIADTPAAAWAWARHGKGPDGKSGVLPPGSGLDRLGPLPVEALRLADDIAGDLKRLGLSDVAALAKLPRGPLTRRFGPQLVDRLDKLFGRSEEPISPRLVPAPWRARASLAEPILTRDAIDTVLRHLLDALCNLLEQHQRGARQLSLHAYRVDGHVQTLRVGTSRASRSPPHLFRLYRDLLDGIDPGFGIDMMLLDASATEPLAGSQQAIAAPGEEDDDGIAECIDRLQARLGRKSVFRLQAMESHWPERAIHAAPPLAPPLPLKPTAAVRPVALLPYPQMLDIEAGSTGWPGAIHWHRRRRDLVRMEGPERIAPEWWRDDDETPRDYYRAEDTEGRRYWLFRSRETWFLHGLFA